MSKLRSLTSRLNPIPKKTVWGEFTPLAVQHGAVNLGQGFPDFHLEQFVKDGLDTAIKSGNALLQQYTRTLGHRRLNVALSSTFSPLFGRTLDPDKNIIVTTGATGALYNAINTIVQEGDEVIIIEPYFDVYPGDIIMAGGKPVYVPLRPHGTTANEWTLDRDEFRKAITAKTKLVIVNTPQNVPGKTWSREELQFLADEAEKHNLYVISDEVYERMVYDGCEHVRLATLPRMFDRTITIGSAGKTFSATGWKIGWVIANEEIISGMAQYQAHLTYCVATPLQDAIAQALEAASSTNYYTELNDMYTRKRDRLMEIVSQSGLKVIKPQGSYFFLADITDIDLSRLACDNGGESSAKDWQFCRWMTQTIGVGAIPVSAFYSDANKDIGENFIRFAFCKDDPMFEEAAKRLQKLREFI